MRNTPNNRAGEDAIGLALGRQLRRLLDGKIDQDLMQAVQMAVRSQIIKNIDQAGLRFARTGKTTAAETLAALKTQYVAPTSWADSRRPIKRKTK